MDPGRRLVHQRGSSRRQRRGQMEGTTMRGESHTRSAIAVRVAGIYGVVASLWIMFSDRLIGLAADGPHQLTQMQTYKGWGFVAITAALLALLVHGYTRRLAEEQASVRRLNRMYRMLSGINGMLLRTQERPVLLRSACELAAEHGGFALARITISEPAAHSVHAGPARSLPDLLDGPLARYLADGSGVSRFGERIAVLSDDRVPAPWRAAAAAAAVGTVAMFPITRPPSGEQVGWLELYSSEPSAFDDDERRLLAEVAADIGLGLQTIAQADRLHTLIHHDVLTGLPNERLLVDRLGQAMAGAGRSRRTVAVIHAHIPELTRLADTRGRQAADRLTKAVAAHLQDHSREGDTVARTGPDAFTLVLADMRSAEDMRAPLERLLQGPTMILDSGRPPVRVSLRAGAALYPGDGASATDLLQHAALALRASELAPGRCSYYAPAMNQAARARLELEHGLANAIDRDEMHLAYQLLVDIASGRPSGAEALLRWDSAQLGSVPPAQFIPVAERCGLIHSLGRWVLDVACRQLASWRAAGAGPQYVSVNVSAHQLLEDDFPDQVRLALQNAGLDGAAGSLVLEVTESAVVRDVARAGRNLDAVRAIGVRVFLDDFGTGYSSLSYLSLLPVDALKIDRAFVRGLPDDARAGVLVKAIIALAHGLDLKVVAEGIETEAQLRALRDLGCDTGQGYLFNRPSRADELVSQRS